MTWRVATGTEEDGVRGSRGGPVIVGQSPKLLAAVDLAHRIAGTDIPVLIIGETGTGKELIANLIHSESGRRGHFVDVDCGALPDDLIEGLLFGHRRGAFTGAIHHANGLIAEADGGTLFLDELGSLPVRGQAKLLRVLETGEVRRVGDARARKVDFRVVATAQRHLAERVTDGAFRGDLMQRVAGVVIQLPGLAQRIEDIPRLARHFAAAKGASLTDAALDALCSLAWPGNVRQLRWTVTRSTFFALDGVVDARQIREALETGPRLFCGTSGSAPDVHPVSELAALCRRHEGDAQRIADALGVARATAYRRIRDAGLSLREFRAG